MGLDSPSQSGRGEPLVVFTLDRQRHALRLNLVERIVRSVEVAFLPKAPNVVMGLISVKGQVVPVFDIRCRLVLPERDPNLSDQLILARAGRRLVALPVDQVEGVQERSAAQSVEAKSVLPDLQGIDGVVKDGDGLIFIQDLEKFLSIREEQSLEEALTHV